MSNHKTHTGNISADLDNYIENHTSPEDDLLYNLRRQTHLKLLRPRMVSGPVQGQLLTMLCQMIQPQTVLEIGTFTGYSAICMARGLGQNGHIDTIERDDELESFIRSWVQKAKLEDKITLHIGDALQVIKTIEKKYDLVFMDGDKREYPKYYEAIMTRMNAGGFILADNILWNGKVVEAIDPTDEYTRGILQFNTMVKEDPRVEQVILPVRDGLMMIRVNP
ncbi:putative O-methyltransferase YrrM [Marinilabilia salmonicolor]|jgi:predicted O-methyltransferase YrrM|uniref:O-methyltransferase n=1 Tax=Marinilabilia salmonicolor TaxID=989 RepID=UPI000D0746BC|nr:O-methyltransferase [Marinilabilia salmonicolor]PRY99893.1 putative O-methyltransferase YrrM [Marinilabilia salmonicolor]